MVDETLRVLEYDKICRLLAGFTSSLPGKELAVALTPLPDLGAARERLETVREMLALLDGESPLPVGGGCDLHAALVRLRVAGSWLAPEELLTVQSSAEAAAACRKRLAGREDLARLSALGQSLAPLPQLRASLTEALGPRGEILDRASFELGEIRRDIVTLRQRIRKALEDLLASESLTGVFQDRIVTERGGRYVVPVRADHRGRVKGFVHDESASGQTLFVEPATVLEKNNQLQSRLREEKREEERILRRLAETVRNAAAELATNQALLAELDLLTAIARFSAACDAEIPQLTDVPLLELRGARHPLLLLAADGRRRANAAVPVDLLLGADGDTLVISGPNTGGKTVALKTAGLLVLMAKAGLPLPCAAGSRVHPFARVFADIGDEQSIEASLSTFSGHLLRLGRILAEADGDSLVLLDEVGTGTDPVEGAALAMAVLDTLRERGARTVVTTHLNLVKGYAHLQSGVENAAVEFDALTFAPSYRLHYGIPGASNAFAIARRLGLDGQVLARAESYLGRGEREGLQLVEELNRLRREADRDRGSAQALLAQARQEQERRRQLLQELEAQKKLLLEKAARRAQQLVRDAEARLAALFEQAGRGAADARERAGLAHELAEVGATVTALRNEPLRPHRSAREARTGELLRIPALNSDGEVVRVHGDEVELSLGGKKLRLPLAELESYAPRRFARKGGGTTVRGAVRRDGFTPRLLLVGRRVDEALALLERFLDDALLHGAQEVEVVHGAGEGILRRAVRAYVAGHREVAAFHAADPGQGGDNVTIVGLRMP